MNHAQNVPPPTQKSSTLQYGAWNSYPYIVGFTVLSVIYSSNLVGPLCSIRKRQPCQLPAISASDVEEDEREDEGPLGRANERAFSPLPPTPFLICRRDLSFSLSLTFSVSLSLSLSLSGEVESCSEIKNEAFSFAPFPLLCSLLHSFSFPFAPKVLLRSRRRKSLAHCAAGKLLALKEE